MHLTKSKDKSKHENSFWRFLSDKSKSQMPYFFESLALSFSKFSVIRNLTILVTNPNGKG